MSFTVTLNSFESIDVSFTMSSPTLLGDKPRGLILGARDEATPTFHPGTLQPFQLLCNAFSDLLWWQTQRTDLRGQRWRNSHFTACDPHVHFEHLGRIKLGRHGCQFFSENTGVFDSLLLVVASLQKSESSYLRIWIKTPYFLTTLHITSLASPVWAFVTIKFYKDFPCVTTKQGKMEKLQNAMGVISAKCHGCDK